MAPTLHMLSVFVFSVNPISTSMLIIKTLTVLEDEPHCSYGLSAEQHDGVVSGGPREGLGLAVGLKL